MKRALLILLLLLLVAPGTAQPPIQEQMKTWRLRIRPPDPRYLHTQGEFYGVDGVHRYWFPLESTDPMEPSFLRPTDDGMTLEITGPASWRPDPAAQVDQIKAVLVQEARKKTP